MLRHCHSAKSPSNITMLHCSALLPLLHLVLFLSDTATSQCSPLLFLQLSYTCCLMPVVKAVLVVTADCWKTESSKQLTPLCLRSVTNWGFVRLEFQFKVEQFLWHFFQYSTEVRIILRWIRVKTQGKGTEKNLLFLGLCPKLWVGG